MTEPDRTRPKAPQRFVPTLTEVVESAQSAATPRNASPFSVAELEAVVDAAVKKMETQLSSQLPEALAILLHEQALVVGEQIRREVRRRAKQAVVAALADALASKQ